jgi:hypothetical protein
MLSARMAAISARSPSDSCSAASRMRLASAVTDVSVARSPAWPSGVARGFARLRSPPTRRSSVALGYASPTIGQPSILGTSEWLPIRRHSTARSAPRAAIQANPSPLLALRRRPTRLQSQRCALAYPRRHPASSSFADGQPSERCRRRSWTDAHAFAPRRRRARSDRQPSRDHRVRPSGMVGDSRRHAVAVCRPSAVHAGPTFVLVGPSATRACSHAALRASLAPKLTRRRAFALRQPSKKARRRAFLLGLAHGYPRFWQTIPAHERRQFEPR